MIEAFRSRPVLMMIKVTKWSMTNPLIILFFFFFFISGAKRALADASWIKHTAINVKRVDWKNVYKWAWTKTVSFSFSIRFFFLLFFICQHVRNCSHSIWIQTIGKKWIYVWKKYEYWILVKWMMLDKYETVCWLNSIGRPMVFQYFNLISIIQYFNCGAFDACARTTWMCK